MVTLFKRGAIYHFDVVIAGRRLRASLGTKDGEIAEKRKVQLAYAIEFGPASEAWPALHLVLPVQTVQALHRAMVGPAPSLTLLQVERKFVTHLEKRVALGRMSQRTRNIYESSVNRLFNWLTDQGVQEMDKIGAADLEDYELHRQQEILASPGATNGRSILMDIYGIKSLLDFCVEEDLMKPVKFNERPTIRGKVESAEPFTALELGQMAQRAEGIVRLVYLIFRWTGMRCSDVSALAWSDIDFASKRIIKLTQKRKKQIVVPLAPELLAELERWRDQLQPEGKDQVIPNASRTKLYTMVVSLGRKAGVFGAHPHRFRTSLVVYLLEKQTPLFEISKVIGDSVSVLEKSYSRFTDEMSDRVREAMVS